MVFDLGAIQIQDELSQKLFTCNYFNFTNKRTRSEELSSNILNLFRGWPCYENFQKNMTQVRKGD